MLCGGLILKKILCFIVLLFSLAVPAFASDLPSDAFPVGFDEPMPLASLDNYNSDDYWSGVSDYSYPSLPRSAPYYLVWVNASGDLRCIFSSSPIKIGVYSSSGHLSVVQDSSCFLYVWDGSSWVLKSLSSSSSTWWSFGYPDGAQGRILDVVGNAVSYNDNSVFFSQAPSPTPTPVPLAEVVQQMQGEQIQVSLIPSLTGSLGVLVPFGIGLLALLVGSVILPKVLRKFL